MKELLQSAEAGVNSSGNEAGPILGLGFRIRHFRHQVSLHRLPCSTSVVSISSGSPGSLDPGPSMQIGTSITAVLTRPKRPSSMCNYHEHRNALDSWVLLHLSKELPYHVCNLLRSHSRILTYWMMRSVSLASCETWYSLGQCPRWDA